MYVPAERLIRWLIRVLNLLLAVLERRTRSGPLEPPRPPEGPPPQPAPPTLPPHRSPYAAAAAAEAEADRRGAVRRYPPPSTRPYAPPRWHQPEQPEPPAGRHTGAAHRLTQGRRRAELWLATHGIDTGPRRIHGVPVGGPR
jgi:hypothetical protein